MGFINFIKESRSGLGNIIDNFSDKYKKLLGDDEIDERYQKTLEEPQTILGKTVNFFTNNPIAKTVDLVTQPLQNLTKIDESVKQYIIDKENEAIIKKYDKQLDKGLKDAGLTSEDLFRYKSGLWLPEEKKQVIEKNKLYQKLDIKPEDLKKAKEYLSKKDKSIELSIDKAFNIVQTKFGKEIDSLPLDAETKSKLAQYIAQNIYMNVGNRKDVINKADTYVNTLLYKIREYNGDLQRVANDKDLLELDTQISNELWKSKLKEGAGGISESIKSGDFLTTLARGAQFLGTAATATAHYAAKGLRDLYNLNPWGQIETETLLQGKINRINSGPVAKWVDAVFEGAANIIPDLISIGKLQTAGRLPLQAVKKVSGLSKAAKLGEWAVLNNAVNSVANAHYDPELHRTTILTDVAFDVIGEGLMRGIGAGWRAYKKTKDLKTFYKVFGDTTVKVGEKEYKIADLFTKGIDEKNLANVIESVGAGKISKLEKAIKDVDGLVKKAKGVDKQSVKKAIVNTIGDLIKKYGSTPETGKFLQEMAKTKSGTEKAYDAILKTFESFKDNLEKSFKKGQQTIQEIDLLLDTERRFADYVSESIKKEGDDIKIKEADLDKPVAIKYEAASGEISDEAIVEALDGAIKHIKNKYGRKAIDAVTFANEIKNYFKALVGDINEQAYKKLTQISDAILNLAKKQPDKKISLIKGKLPKGAKGYIQGNKIKISILPSLYKNPVELYIVAFHELIHGLGEGAYKEVLGKKLSKKLIGLYNKWKRALEAAYKLSNDPKIKKLLDTIFKDEEEFVAYMVGEGIVRGDKALRDRILKQLEQFGIEVGDDANLFKEAINKYLAARYGTAKGADDIIREAIEIASSLFEGRALSYKLTSFFKNKNIGQISEVIDEMTEEEFKKTVGDVVGNNLKKIYEKIWDIDPQLAKNIFNAQILLNLSGETGLKASYLFAMLTDLVDDFAKLPKEEILKKLERYSKVADEVLLGLGNDIINVLEKGIINGNIESAYRAIIKSLSNIGYSKKAATRIGTALKYAVRSYKMGKRADTFALIANTRATLVKKYFGKLYKANVDYFNKFVSYAKNVIEKGTKNTIDLSSIGIKVNNIKEVINELMKTKGGKRISTLIKEGLIKYEIKDKTQAKAAISVLFRAFDPKVAYKLAQPIAKEFGLNKLVLDYYNTINKTLKEVKKLGVEPGRKAFIGLQDKRGAPLIEQFGDDLYVVGKDGRTYVYDIVNKELKEVGAKKTSKFLMDVPGIRQENRFSEVIRAILDNKNLSEFLNIKNKLNKC